MVSAILKRFPGEMPERRRLALAMMSAGDDGIGSIRAKLSQYGIDKKTLIVFISDNGAPIKMHKEDITLDFRGGAWDGSINDPLNGEKGTLLEGGIRVPFIVSWPGTIPGGVVCNEPVISLDVAATALATAGLPKDDALDGVDLMPLLTGPLVTKLDRSLYWRFWGQAAIRKERWKRLQLAGGAKYLFDLYEDKAETTNLIEQHPDVAAGLLVELQTWLDQMPPSSTPPERLNDQEEPWFEHYLGWQK